MNYFTKSILKDLAIGIGGCLLAILVIAGITIKLFDSRVLTQKGGYKKAIVRLHDTETGRFFCSATIISDHLALTAAHCVVRQSPFGIYVLQKVDIRTADLPDQPGTPGLFVKGNPNTDYVLLSGDFTTYSKMKIISDTADIIKAVQNDHLIVCGFPAGGKLLCVPFYNANFENFKLRGDSFLYPGMSGGPCIDTDTGNVIANNFAVDGADSFVNPLIEIWKVLEVTEQ